MNNVKKRRLELGLTQSQLCEQAGMYCSSHVSNIELNKVMPGVLVAIRIARALETSVEELFGSDLGGEDK